VGSELAARRMTAIGTLATVVVTDPVVADEAAVILAHELAAIDAACSRFRDDSEISVLQRRAPAVVEVSSLLFDAVRVACVVAERTAGTVDPTVGSAVADLGYDRDFDALTPDATPTGPTSPAPGWWCVELDPRNRTIRLPQGVRLDLGATAKALAADRAARRLADHLECGVLVNLGGDVSVSGVAPAGGWAIGIAPDSRAPLGAVDQVVAITDGGLATSGTTARCWLRGGRLVHHIVDPATGDMAEPVWALASVAADDCVAANAASTASIVWGPDAPGNLASLGVSARLVDHDGGVVLVGGWPADPSTSASYDSNERTRRCSR